MVGEKQFTFTPKNLARAKKLFEFYPEGKKKSVVMGLLYLVQEQCGWVSESAMRCIADMLDIPYISVYELVSFYTLYNTKPVGKYLIQVCRTTPCWLRSSEEILSSFKKKLGISLNETTKDNLFTLKEVECLGACINAPIVKINHDFYENLTFKKVENILMNLLKKKK